jgi:hypothetical protein
LAFFSTLPNVGNFNLQYPRREKLIRASAQTETSRTFSRLRDKMKGEKNICQLEIRQRQLQ